MFHSFSFNSSEYDYCSTRKTGCGSWIVIRSIRMYLSRVLSVALASNLPWQLASWFCIWWQIETIIKIGQNCVMGTISNICTSSVWIWIGASQKIPKMINQPKIKKQLKFIVYSKENEISTGKMMGEYFNGLYWILLIWKNFTLPYVFVKTFSFTKFGLIRRVSMSDL